MSESMIEKCARAAMIEGACGYQLPTGERVFCDDDRLSSDVRADCACKTLTRVVLEELRKPTDEVLMAGWKGLPPPRPYDLASFRKGFVAAIDAALALPLKEEG